MATYRWMSRAYRRCAHSRLAPIYGDAILALNTRLICNDCGRSIDGPVTLAAIRAGESRRARTPRPKG